MGHMLTCRSQFRACMRAQDIILQRKMSMVIRAMSTILPVSSRSRSALNACDKSVVAAFPSYCALSSSKCLQKHTSHPYERLAAKLRGWRHLNQNVESLSASSRIRPKLNTHDTTLSNVWSTRHPRLHHILRSPYPPPTHTHFLRVEFRATRLLCASSKKMGPLRRTWTLRRKPTNVNFAFIQYQRASQDILRILDVTTR
jgi:hypothetical protein